MSMAREELAERVRALLPPRVHCLEKKMFGGIAFMRNGNMLVVPMKDGSLLARVGEREIGRRRVLAALAPLGLSMAYEPQLVLDLRRAGHRGTSAQ